MNQAEEHEHDSLDVLSPRGMIRQSSESERDDMEDASRKGSLRAFIFVTGMCVGTLMLAVF